MNANIILNTVHHLVILVTQQHSPPSCYSCDTTTLSTILSFLWHNNTVHQLVILVTQKHSPPSCHSCDTTTQSTILSFLWHNLLETGCISTVWSYVVWNFKNGYFIVPSHYDQHLLKGLSAQETFIRERGKRYSFRNVVCSTYLFLTHNRRKFVHLA